MTRVSAWTSCGMRADPVPVRNAQRLVLQSFSSRLLAIFGGLLVLALMSAPLANAATTRAQATKTALKTLKVSRSKAPISVYAMLQPVPKRATITEIGPAKFAKMRKVKPTVLARTSATERVWLFYADTVPYGQFQHPGRIVLVSVRTGRVVLNKPTRFAPLVNGKLPPFLGNSKRYEAKTWRVFYRPWKQTAAAAAQIGDRAKRDVVFADPVLRGELAKTMGTQSTCVVVAGARGAGVGGEVSARSATFVEVYFRTLRKLDPSIGVWRYAPTSTTTFAEYLEEVASEQPCRNLLIYMAGQTTATGTPLIMLDTMKVQEFRAAQLRSLLRAHRSMKVSVVMDTSSGARFLSVVQKEPNLAAFLAPRGAKRVAFGYLPEMQVGKQVRRNVDNPRRINEFTNDLLYGLSVFTTSPSEVQHAISQSGGPDGSIAAWLLGRGDRLARDKGLSDSVASNVDDLHEKTPSTPPPPAANNPPVATDLSLTTPEDTPAALALSATDPDGDVITYEIVTQPAHGTVSLVAPFSYSPLPNYHGPDVLTYRAVDIRGGVSAAMTVSITVTPVDDAPAVVLDAAASYVEGDPQLVLSPTALVDDVDAHAITGATVTISSGYVDGEDELGFVDTATITHTWDALSGTLTLTGTATAAEYQAALRTITYDNLSVGAITTGARAVTAVVTNELALMSSSTLALAVQERNDPPVVADFPIAATEDTAEPFTFSATDPEGDPVTYNVVTPPTNGAVTGTGASRTYTPDADFNGVDSFTYTATDSRGAVSTTQTATVTVAAVNDAPTVSLDTALSYTENDSATVLSPAATVGDVDDTTVLSATVSITGGFATGQDVLASAGGTGITPAWNGTTGVLSLTGSATLADYQAVLRAVTYTNTSENPSATPRTISVVVSDATLASTAATMTVTVLPVNDAPVATASSFSTNEDTASPFTMAGTDAEAGALTYALASLPTHGVITGSGATRTYTPDADYAGADSFTFTATDPSGAVSAPATITVTVNAINDAPTASLDTAMAYTENDGAKVLSPTATVGDIDNTTLSSATVSITGGFATGQDVLAAASGGGITAVWNGTTGVLSLTGSAPLATYQAALRAMTYTNTSENPSATPRTISLVVSDGTASSSSATMSVTVTPVNDAPSVADFPVSTAEDIALPITLTGTDPENDTLTFTTMSLPANGVLSGTGASRTYTPNANFNGTDSFTYRATDPSGANSATNATVTITVTPVNDPPVVNLVATTLAYTEGTGPQTLAPAATTADVEGPNLTGMTVTISSGFAAGQDVLTATGSGGVSVNYASNVLTLSGTASLATYQTVLRTVTYENTSNAPSVTARTISVVANDGTAPSTAATMSVTITPINSAPVVTASGGSPSYNENAGALTIDSTITATDADSTTLASATISITGGFVTGDVLAFSPANGITPSYAPGTGILTLSGSSLTTNYQLALRAVTFSSTSDNPGTSRIISFKVNDGSVDSNTSTKTITVVPSDDPSVVTPTVAALAYTENAAATVVDNGITVTDPDSTQLTSATVQMTTNFNAAQDVLSWVDNNGGDGITLDVPGSPSGTIALVGTGTIAEYVAAIRAVRYANTSDTPSVLARTVTFVVNAGAVPSNTGSRTINVSATDDPPVAVANSTSVTRDTGANAIDVLTNDTDVDAGPKLITAVTQGAHGTVAITGGGTGLTFTPTPAYCDDVTPDTFTYSITGGSMATVSVIISCHVNQPPVAVDDSLMLDNGAIGNTPFVVYPGAAPTVPGARKLQNYAIIGANDTDPDGDSLSVVAGTFTSVDGASVTLAADGTFTYVPNAVTSCTTDHTDAFDYTLQDPSGATDVATVNIGIEGCVWYVDNSGGAGDGSAAAPFNTLAAAITAAGTTSNYVISVARGTGTSTGLTGAFTIADNQRLIGSGADLKIDVDGAGPTYTEQTLQAAGTFPMFSGSGAANVITVGAGTQVSGVQIDHDGSGNAILMASKLGVVLDQVRIIDAGTPTTGAAVRITGTAANMSATISNLTIDTKGAGISVTGATLSLLDAGLISITTTTGLAFTNTSSVTLPVQGVIDDITVTGGTAGGVSLGTMTGSGIVLGQTSLSLTTSSSGTAALALANSNIVQIPSGSNAVIDAHGGPAVSAASLASGSALNIDTLNSDSSIGGGITFSNAAGSNASLIADAGNINNYQSTAVSVTNGTGNVSFLGSITENSGPNPTTSVSVSSRAGGTVTLGTLTDGSDPGGGILLSNNSGGTVRFNGNVAITTSSTSALSITNTTGGGAVEFLGDVTINNSSTANGVAMTGTTPPSPLRFMGGLHVRSTGSGSPFNVTFATLAITGSGNTLEAVNGIPYRSVSTSFAPEGVTLESVKSNGATQGIVLSGANSNGFFNLTGTGGTCTDTTDCTGGAIRNSTATLATQPAVQISSVAAPVTINSLAVDNSASIGVGMTSATGTVTLDDVVVTNNKNDGIANATSAGTFSLNSAIVTGNGDAANENGLDLANSGTTTAATTNITNSTISTSHDTAVRLGGGSTTTFPAKATFTGNTVSGGAPGQVATAKSLELAFTGTAPSVQVNIANNAFTGASGSAISAAPTGANCASTCFYDVTVNNNTIGNGTVGSGSSAGRGLDFDMSGVEQMRIAATNNTIRHYYLDGAQFYIRGASGSQGKMDVTVTGNTISDPDTGGGTSSGIYLRSGLSTAGDTSTLCANIGGAGALGNTLAGSADGGNDVDANRYMSALLRLYTWDGVSPILGFIQGRNTSATTAGTVGTPTGTATPCATPVLP